MEKEQEERLRSCVGGITCKCGNPISIERINDYWIEQIKIAQEEKREIDIIKILERVKSLPTYQNGKFEIVGGLYSDEKVRGSNIEKVDLVNRYAVYKAITNDINTYKL